MGGKSPDELFEMIMKIKGISRKNPPITPPAWKKKTPLIHIDNANDMIFPPGI